MAQFKARVKCFVDNTLRQEDDVFEYNGPKNTNLISVGGPVEADESDEPLPAKAKWVPKAKREKLNMD